MSTPINVTIDGQSVLEDLAACEIKKDISAYCYSVSLSLKSKQFWTLCDPTTGFGRLRIKVIIGGTTYDFLAEERSTQVGPGVAFSVWGRSKQALLAVPYSKTATDTDKTKYPWQTGRTTASQIVSYIVSGFCSYGVTVQWDALNFAVYKESFSTSNSSPIDVISTLAGVIGAQLMPQDDGSLTVQEYSVTAGSPVETYDDLDDIVGLSETVEYPSGYNAVTVYGYDASKEKEGASNAVISVSRIDSGSIFPGRSHKVRVTYYHPGGQSPVSAASPGCSASGFAGGFRTVTEKVNIIFGKGRVSGIPFNGQSEVTGSPDLPFTTRTVQYTEKYRDFHVSGGGLGEHGVLFYFTDKSTATLYSFTVEEWDGDGRLSYDEVSHLMDRETFNKYDIDGDGFLSPEEFAAWQAEDFNDLDKDGDGRLSYDEVSHLMDRETFNKYDIDGDGFLSPAEFAAWQADQGATPGTGYDPGYDDPWDVCGSIVVEKVSPETVVSGSDIVVRVYGKKPSTRNSHAAKPFLVAEGLEQVTEDITFINGEAFTSYPIDWKEDVNIKWPKDISGTPNGKTGSTRIIMRRFMGKDEFYSIPAIVTYYTEYYEYTVTVPATWISTAFHIWFGFQGCSKKTLELSIDAADLDTDGDEEGRHERDVTIQIRDYVTDEPVPGANIWIDGTWKGGVNADGELTIKKMKTGTYRIKITASNYVDSDQDDLANDSFVVSG